VGLEHAVLETLSLEHRLRHVVEGHHAHQRTVLVVPHRHITRMLLEHEAPHVVEVGIGRDHDRLVVHVVAHVLAAERAAILMQRGDHLAEGQHPDQPAALHHDKGTDVLFRHGVDSIENRAVWRHGEENVSFYLEYFGYLHGTVLLV